MAYTEKGEELIQRFIERLSDIAKVESEPKMEGRNLSAILVPQSKKGKKQKQQG
jgi:translation initiation factor IF-3